MSRRIPDPRPQAAQPAGGDQSGRACVGEPPENWTLRVSRVSADLLEYQRQVCGQCPPAEVRSCAAEGVEFAVECETRASVRIPSRKSKPVEWLDAMRRLAEIGGVEAPASSRSVPVNKDLDAEILARREAALMRDTEVDDDGEDFK